jgi:hypothetical protein
MKNLKQLFQDVEDSRNKYLETVKHMTYEQGIFKPDTKRWSVSQITEHLVLAENGGINNIWKAIEARRTGNSVWTGEHINSDLSIEEVVKLTWREKEESPASADPKLGGPLKFWIISLENCRSLLKAITKELEGEDMRQIIYPHPISGPLDAGQRFEFLRFHIDRHREQVERLTQSRNFPLTVTQKEYS